MSTPGLAALVKVAISANVATYESKFGPRSLDEPISPGATVTLLDRLAQVGVDLSDLHDGDTAMLRRYPRVNSGIAPHSILYDCTRLRVAASDGQGWPSSLAILEARSLSREAEKPLSKIEKPAPATRRSRSRSATLKIRKVPPPPASPTPSLGRM